MDDSELLECFEQLTYEAAIDDVEVKDERTQAVEGEILRRMRQGRG